MSQRQIAANTRRYIEIHYTTGVGQYGFRTTESLSVRVDGLRFRHSSSGFRWNGNEGSVPTMVEYLSPADARELWQQNVAGQHEESFEEAVAAALRK